MHLPDFVLIARLRSLVLFIACLLQGTNYAVANDNLSGHYLGRLGDTEAILKLDVSGGTVSGRIRVEGLPDTNLMGKLSEGVVIGAASSSRGNAFFEGYRKFGALVIVIRETGSVTGQEIETRLEFFPTQETIQPGKPPAVTERDQALVGSWTTRRLVSRGDMVLPVTTAMSLSEDGSYRERNDPDTGSKRGEWRSPSGQLEIKASGTEAWSRLGEYRLRGEHLIVIPPRGEAQVWTRTSE